LHERDFVFQRQRQVAIARINALLQLPPFLPLPPPPKEIQAEGELPDPPRSSGEPRSTSSVS
jgi:hypothetical protein